MYRVNVECLTRIRREINAKKFILRDKIETVHFIRKGAPLLFAGKFYSELDVFVKEENKKKRKKEKKEEEKPKKKGKNSGYDEMK